MCLESISRGSNSGFQNEMCLDNLKSLLSIIYVVRSSIDIEIVSFDEGIGLG